MAGSETRQLESSKYVISERMQKFIILTGKRKFQGIKKRTEIRDTNIHIATRSLLRKINTLLGISYTGRRRGVGGGATTS